MAKAPILGNATVAVDSGLSGLSQAVGPGGMMSAYLEANDKAEKEKIERERQAKADARADQLFQMQVGDRNEKLLAKEAANSYMQNLAGATSAGVGLQDQKLLGETVAQLGKDAETAYKAGDKVAGDAFVAKQTAYMDRVLPAMNKSFNESPQAKLDLMSTMTAGREDLSKAIDPQTRLAIFKEATQPFEKMVDRAQVAKDRVEDRNAQYENQLKLLKQQESMRESAEDRRDNRAETKALAAAKIANDREAQKQVDTAIGDYKGAEAYLKSLPQTDDVKKQLSELNSAYAILQEGMKTGDKTVPISVKALSETTKFATDKFKRTEERGYTKAEEDKKADAKLQESLLTAMAEGLDVGNETFGGGLVNALTDTLKNSEDKAVIRAKYDSNDKAPALIADLLKARPQDRAKLSAILNSKVDADTWFSTSKEDMLSEYLKQPEVVESLLGYKPRKANSSEGSYYKGAYR